MNVQTQYAGEVFQRGYEILDEKGLLIVGMSPGNSYYKKDVIDELIKTAGKYSEDVKIMIPDLPSEHTYRAIGYSESKAKRKARLNGNTLENHCIESIARFDSNIEIIDWAEDVQSSKAYQSHLTHLGVLYKNNSEFRKEARETTRAVLRGKTKEGVDLELAIDEGVNYLLEELAFLTAAPEIYGVEKLAYAYHQEWPIFEKLLEGYYDGRMNISVGFVVIE